MKVWFFAGQNILGNLSDWSVELDCQIMIHRDINSRNPGRGSQNAEGLGSRKVDATPHWLDLGVFGGRIQTIRKKMSWKRKMSGGVMAFIGFMLSPLSWWNDLFVNVPLAAGFAWLVSLLYKPAFAASVVIGYWLTNVLGLVLLHKGGQRLLSSKEIGKYSRRELFKDVVISLLYTLFILLLVRLRILQPITDYFSDR